jgi:acyl-CoA thioesterase FadM
MHRALQAASRVTVTEPLRGYEVAQDGCLPASGYARFFELMRWELGRRGHITDNAMPKRGVVRAQTHVYGAELRFPCTWTGRTHLVRVGGSSLHYAHDVTLPDGRVAVRARTVIVLLDAHSRPAAAPAYLRDYVDPSFDAPEPLLVAEPAWTGLPTYRVQVRPSDQDSFGHVNQARYIDFVDDARRAAGLSAPRGLSVSYEQEALAGDVLDVEVVPGVDGRHAYRMVRVADGAVVNHGALSE